jgi:signal transduction histidine kinase
MQSLSFASHTAPVTQSASENPVSLKSLVNQLLNSFLPMAVAKKSFIINDVSKEFEVRANEQVLAFVIGSLMNNAILSSQNVCIRVEAVRKADGIYICVRNNGTCYYSTVANGFTQVVEAARSIGGHINIYNQRHEGTVVTFTVAA